MLLDDETFKVFGYHLDAISEGSNKKCIVRCDTCGENVTKNRSAIKGAYQCRQCYLVCSVNRMNASKNITTNIVLWSDMEDEKLKGIFGTLSYNNMLEYFPGRSKKALIARANLLGLRSSNMKSRGRQKFICDTAFFSRTTLQSCYWAGLLAADGNVSSYGNQIKITLKISDSYHLEAFKQETNSNHNVFRTNSMLNGKIFPQGVFSQNCIEWKHDLAENFNITPKKSLTIKHPNLTGDLALAFIKGYIDGDGSIGWAAPKLKKNQYFNIELSGTFDMLTWVSKIFSRFIDITTTITRHGNIYCYGLSGPRAMSIYHIMKALKTPQLQRKWIY